MLIAFREILENIGGGVGADEPATVELVLR